MSAVRRVWWQGTRDWLKVAVIVGASRGFRDTIASMKWLKARHTGLTRLLQVCRASWWLVATLCMGGCVNRPPPEATVGVGAGRSGTDAAVVADGAMGAGDHDAALVDSILPPAEQQLLLPYLGTVAPSASRNGALRVP